MNEIMNRVARMRFDEEQGLLYITALPNVLLDLETVEHHFKMISELTGDKEHYALIDSTNPYEATPEALEYAARPEVFRARKAAAYVHTNSANRYKIMRVQIKMKATIPTCAFKEKDEAVLWLKSLNLVNRESL